MFHHPHAEKKDRVSEPSVAGAFPHAALKVENQTIERAEAKKETLLDVQVDPCSDWESSLSKGTNVSREK
jgi:hypothetical protein